MWKQILKTSRSLKKQFEENSKIFETKLKDHVAEETGNLEDEINKGLKWHPMLMGILKN